MRRACNGRGEQRYKKLIERASEVLWVVDHIDDIESDLSVFHRIDDYTEMDGPRFLRLATRLIHYQGSVRAAAEQNDTAQEESSYTGDLGTDPNKPDVMEVLNAGDAYFT